MKIYKIASNRFYHGSYDLLENGTILVPEKGNFMNSFEDFEMPGHGILEKYRPMEMIPRSKAVFMTDNPDDIDNCGAATDFIYSVEPLGNVEKHDINWFSEIESAYYDGATEEEMEKIANNYWQGIPHDVGAVWEYLTPRARIIELLEEN